MKAQTDHYFVPVEGRDSSNVTQNTGHIWNNQPGSFFFFLNMHADIGGVAVVSLLSANQQHSRPISIGTKLCSPNWGSWSTRPKDWRTSAPFSRARPSTSVSSQFGRAALTLKRKSEELPPCQESMLLSLPQSSTQTLSPVSSVSLQIDLSTGEMFWVWLPLRHTKRWFAEK